MKIFFAIGVWWVVAIPNVVTGQTRDLKSGVGQLNFSEIWVWEYTDIEGKTGEMAIYRHPQSNSWLLTPEAYGNTDEMCDWVLARPDGIYYIAYRNPESDNRRFLTEVRQKIARVKSLPEYWKPSGRKRNFGDLSLGFPEFKGCEYQVSYIKTNDTSRYYIGETKADFSAISTFNDLDIDAKISIHFPKDTPPNTIVLSEHSFLSNGSINHHFKYISQTEYHLNLSEYQVIESIR